ncbi:MAG: AAA domain-containing protein [Bacteroidota bacterium]
MSNNHSHSATELARLFYIEMMKVQTHETWTHAQKTDALARLLELLFIEVTKAENIQFTTLFARISFACHQFHINKRTQYWIHFFRKKHRSYVADNEQYDLYCLGFKTLAQCIAGLLDEAIPDEILNIIPPDIPFAYTEVKVKAFKKQARVVVLEDDVENDCLLVRDEANPALPVLVKYNIADRNASFNQTIRQVRKIFGLPVTLSLLDVEVDDKGMYRPRAIVVQPDYLLDVSAVANCFQGRGAEPVVYLLNKYLPFEQSIPMILGNIANFFLDELMNNPKAVFKKTFPKVFKTNPLTFAVLPDSAIREIYQKSQKHWVTLQGMVNRGMKRSNIEPSECYLEPSFYDETHGLQGRLDIFYKKESESAIIELKSGKPFMPNKYGIGASHFIQTLLYDLMVRSVFKGEIEPASYILYSGLDTNQLKYAPPVKAEQNEAMQVRNQLVAIDQLLANIREDVRQVPVLQRITKNRFPHIKGYLTKNIERFEKTYNSLEDLERRYFNAFSGLIAREHQLAKTGIQGVDQANGLAALWLDTFDEKELNYQVIKSLKIRENRANEEEPIIVFDKTAATNPLANFRKGDIAVLYPVRQSKSKMISNGQPTDDPEVNSGQDQGTNGLNTPISSQIFKVSVLEMGETTVTVRLRYKQFNKAIFKEFEVWNLEHDQMDMSFNAMYQGLFRMAESSKRKRDLLLTVAAPSNILDDSLSPSGRGREEEKNRAPLPDPLQREKSTSLTKEQETILHKMLHAKDYFLLWGPPGTGKTSQMLKNYAKWVFENTEENLLLLAYTNRAVDEICEAVENISEAAKNSYLRIGSKYSTSERFKGQLLTNKMTEVQKRKELIEILNGHRIFISTLASLSNNLQLLQLKKFRRVVIDEASQILEPMLVGLLPQFEQFILVGDHKQLPAVVVQEAVASEVSDPKLKSIGLHNLRNSLFERLYKRCMENKWNWAFDHLSHQGRMHQDIMRFPGEHFYEGKLKVLPVEIPVHENQVAPITLQSNGHQADWVSAVTSQRIAFVDTPVDWETPSRKTNRFEAEQVAHLIGFFQNQETETEDQTEQSEIPHRMVGKPKTIGVITPYRAQIAQIQEVLKKESIDCNSITIDTVERYQGGARDIILISLCTNAASQMDSLVSLSEEGVDRKLNVALTRAREHVVILGNKKILGENNIYRKLIDFCLAERAA